MFNRDIHTQPSKLAAKRKINDVRIAQIGFDSRFVKRVLWGTFSVTNYPGKHLFLYESEDNEKFALNHPNKRLL